MLLLFLNSHFAKERNTSSRLSNIDVHTWTLLLVALVSSAMSILSTFCGMSVIIHFTTDPFNSVLVLLFWLVPPLFFLAGVRFLGYNAEDSTFNMNWIMVCQKCQKLLLHICVLTCMMCFEQISYYVGYLFSYFALFFALLVSPSTAFPIPPHASPIFDRFIHWTR